MKNAITKHRTVTVTWTFFLFIFSWKLLSITTDISAHVLRGLCGRSVTSCFFPPNVTKGCHPLLIKSPKIFERPQQLPQNKATVRYINEHSLIRRRNYLPNMPPVRRGAANFSHKGNKDRAFPKSATWCRVRIICRDDSISEVVGMNEIVAYVRLKRCSLNFEKFYCALISKISLKRFEVEGRLCVVYKKSPRCMLQVGWCMWVEEVS